MNTFKKQMREIMTMAWQFVKQNGMTMSMAMKKAWLNLRLRCQMTGRVVLFWYYKVDGTLREARGTLKSNLIPQTQGTGHKANESIQTYYDCTKKAWRSFKKANLYIVSLH